MITDGLNIFFKKKDKKPIKNNTMPMLAAIHIGDSKHYIGIPRQVNGQSSRLYTKNYIISMESKEKEVKISIKFN